MWKLSFKYTFRKSEDTVWGVYLINKAKETISRVTTSISPVKEGPRKIALSKLECLFKRRGVCLRFEKCSDAQLGEEKLSLGPISSRIVLYEKNKEQSAKLSDGAHAVDRIKKQRPSQY